MAMVMKPLMLLVMGDSQQNSVNAGGDANLIGSQVKGKRVGTHAETSISRACKINLATMVNK